MARKLKSDKVLFLATLLLVLASVVMVYSASAAMADFRFGNSHLFLVKQGMWAALGIAIMAVIMRVDYRVWRQPALIWAALGFAALARDYAVGIVASATETGAAAKHWIATQWTADFAGVIVHPLHWWILGCIAVAVVLRAWRRHQ